MLAVPHTCHVSRNTRCSSSAATSALVYQLDGGQLACNTICLLVEATDCMTVITYGCSACRRTTSRWPKRLGPLRISCQSHEMPFASPADVTGNVGADAPLQCACRRWATALRGHESPSLPERLPATATNNVGRRASDSMPARSRAGTHSAESMEVPSAAGHDGSQHAGSRDTQPPMPDSLMTIHCLGLVSRAK